MCPMILPTLYHPSQGFLSRTFLRCVWQRLSLFLKLASVRLLKVPGLSLFATTNSGGDSTKLYPTSPDTPLKCRRHSFLRTISQNSPGFSSSGIHSAFRITCLSFHGTCGTCGKSIFLPTKRSERETRGLSAERNELNAKQSDLNA